MGTSLNLLLFEVFVFASDTNTYTFFLKLHTEEVLPSKLDQDNITGNMYIDKTVSDSDLSEPSREQGNTSLDS